MTKEPNVVGVKVLEQNGVNVKELIEALVYNASVEFTDLLLLYKSKGTLCWNGRRGTQRSN